MASTTTAAWRVGADVGGTFTDVIALGTDGRIVPIKVLSTPPAYGEGVVAATTAAITAAGATPPEVGAMLHGTTVATNAILEKVGAVTALVTTSGFRDVLELGRLRRPTLYDLGWSKPPPLVPRRRRVELNGRIHADGTVDPPHTPEDVARLAMRVRSSGADAVAVCLVNSYLRADEERRVADALRRLLPEQYVTASVDLGAEPGEFERTSTAVVNSYVGPVVRDYLTALERDLVAAGVTAPLLVMQSGGGLLDAEQVGRRPVEIIESGPAAGVTAVAALARAMSLPGAVAFEMGGTTVKASLIEFGQPFVSAGYEVGGGMNVARGLGSGAGYPVRAPSIDIAEIGAGGGSIIATDVAGALHVGPESAGSRPGPAAYGNGGERPTLTDANVVLGYLSAEALAGGHVRIHPELAVKALAGVADELGAGVLETARGAYDVAVSGMTTAVKAVTSERGRDPREATMVAFGGPVRCTAPRSPASSASTPLSFRPTRVCSSRSGSSLPTSSATPPPATPPSTPTPTNSDASSTHWPRTSTGNCGPRPPPGRRRRAEPGHALPRPAVRAAHPVACGTDRPVDFGAGPRAFPHRAPEHVRPPQRRRSRRDRHPPRPRQGRDRRPAGRRARRPAAAARPDRDPRPLLRQDHRRRRLRPQRPLGGRHAPARRVRGNPGLRRDCARRLRRQRRQPRRRRRMGGGLDGRPVDEHLRRGSADPPSRLAEAGRTNDSLLELILRNVREPELFRGDLDSQLAANHTGARCLLELVDRHGTDGFGRLVDELLDYSETLVRTPLENAVPGVYEFTDQIDDDGLGGGPIPFRVRVTVDRDGLGFDFTGSSAQVGSALNATASFTRSAWGLLACDIPANSGFYRAFRFEIPTGSILDANRPAARGARGLVAYRIIDTVLGALAPVFPDRVPAAGDGGPNSVAIGITEADGSSTVLWDILCGAWGARPDQDGIDGVSPLGANLANTPVEDIERSGRVRIDGYGYLTDTAGAGRYRGGLGTFRDMTVLAPQATVQIRSDRRTSLPYGLDGGANGTPSLNLRDPGPHEVLLDAKPHITVPGGTRHRQVTAGGGGYGDPRTRDPEAVLQDVLDEKVSRAAARADYYVVVDGDHVDLAATTSLRTAR